MNSSNKEFRAEMFVIFGRVDVNVILLDAIDQVNFNIVIIFTL